MLTMYNDNFLVRAKLNFIIKYYSYLLLCAMCVRIVCQTHLCSLCLGRSCVCVSVRARVLFAFVQKAQETIRFACMEFDAVRLYVADDVPVLTACSYPKTKNKSTEYARFHAPHEYSHVKCEKNTVIFFSLLFSPLRSMRTRQLT